MSAREDPPYLGGCLCGAVRYRIDAPPTVIAQCHCTLCRRAAGAPLVTWATVPTGAFTIVRGTPAQYSFSPRATRQFCPHCGSQITFQYTDRPAEIDVTVGTFDRPEAMEPDTHVWTAAQLPWLHVEDELPRSAGEGFS